MTKELFEALSNLDEHEIKRIFLSYEKQTWTSEEAFWRGVHKARTAMVKLPLEKRQESKRWLLEHGSEPWDGGEVQL